MKSTFFDLIYFYFINKRVVSYLLDPGHAYLSDHTPRSPWHRMIKAVQFIETGTVVQTFFLSSPASRPD